METANQVRIDKFLWAVRLFKTRSLAAEACKKRQVTVDNSYVKPSRTIKPGETISIKEPPIEKQYKIINTAEKRMGAKLTPGYIEEITPESDLEILKMRRLANKMNRPKGMGRPTKKERRDLDNLFNG
ncbi:S4 domain-containing protein [Marinilabiliaceae bacterium ANBcel2]|nr:S4 domain-containing protein [Marinilabiliaceae bacterium ANBcel2]